MRLATYSWYSSRNFGTGNSSSGISQKSRRAPFRARAASAGVLAAALPTIHPLSNAEGRVLPEQALGPDQQHEDRDEIGGDVDECRRDVEAQNLFHHAQQQATDHRALQRAEPAQPHR